MGDFIGLELDHNSNTFFTPLVSLLFKGCKMNKSRFHNSNDITHIIDSPNKVVNTNYVFFIISFLSCGLTYSFQFEIEQIDVF